MSTPNQLQSFAIVPAAGLSRRMGQNKLLLPFGDKTVLECLLDSWQRSSVDQIVVVVGADPRLKELCQQYSVQVVDPAQPPPEMKDSVAEALTFVKETWTPTPSDSWFLAPADLPSLSSEVVDRLLDEAVTHPSEILIPTAEGKRGHPVRFPWELAGQVATLGPHEGVNRLLQIHPVVEIELGSEAAPNDMDTPEEYQRLRDQT